MSVLYRLTGESLSKSIKALKEIDPVIPSGEEFNELLEDAIRGLEIANETLRVNRACVVNESIGQNMLFHAHEAQSKVMDVIVPKRESILWLFYARRVESALGEVRRHAREIEDAISGTRGKSICGKYSGTNYDVARLSTAFEGLSADNPIVSFWVDNFGRVADVPIAAEMVPRAVEAAGMNPFAGERHNGSLALSVELGAFGESVSVENYRKWCGKQNGRTPAEFIQKLAEKNACPEVLFVDVSGDDRHSVKECPNTLEHRMAYAVYGGSARSVEKAARSLSCGVTTVIAVVFACSEGTTAIDVTEAIAAARDGLGSAFYGRCKIFILKDSLKFFRTGDTEEQRLSQAEATERKSRFIQHIKDYANHERDVATEKALFVATLDVVFNRLPKSE